MTTTEPTVNELNDRLAALEAQADRIEAELRRVAAELGVDLPDL